MKMGFPEKMKRIISESLWIQRLISCRKTYRLKKYYLDSTPSLPKQSKKCVVFMVDGKIRHGGLCDRLNGLISTFLFCEERGLDFKVWWKYPFDLELFLIPNEYDWHINQEELSYSKYDSAPFSWGIVNDEHLQITVAENILTFKQRQIHAYTNMYYRSEEFHENFKRLFKLSPLLESEVDENLRKMNSEGYISMTFRYQQLLGDFVEGDYPTLGLEAIKDIMSNALSVIELLKKRHPAILTVLVTSDSRMFLEYVRSKLKYVYIIEGELCHMDYVKGETNQLRHLKSFVDLMMISKAQKAYLCYNSIMYQSTFARTAAFIGGIPYEEYEFS